MREKAEVNKKLKEDFGFIPQKTSREVFEFYVNNVAPATLTTININSNARIGTVQITNGFEIYYGAYDGANIVITFVLLNGSSWVTFRGTLTDLSSYWQISKPVLQANSTGFAFSNTSFYCIYITVLI
jgi:hypothetical protein